MGLSEIIVAVIAVIIAAGGISAYYKASTGQSTITILQANINAYKDSEKLKDARIVLLEGQVANANETIKNLNKVLKNGN